jgi:ubiquinone/menaquinone biosynthesis C-methylase UbiE
LALCRRWRALGAWRFQHEQRVSQRDFLPAAGHDLFLPVYDPLVSLMGFDRARQELVSTANVEPGQHILDIGCGTGTLVVMLKRQFPSAQVVGLDPDPKALRRARSKATRNAVQFDQGFADQLPYKENTFDRIFSSFMFHHLEEHERENMLREVLRVLKSGGSFHLLDFVAGNNSHGFFDRLFLSHARMKDNRDATILELMNRVGLTNAAKTKEGSMLFGLLRTATYQTTK